MSAPTRPAPPAASCAALVRAHRDRVVALTVAAVGADTPAWLAAEHEQGGDPPVPEADGRWPLARLDPTDALLLVAIGLIEIDIRWGALFAALQDPLPSRRPCLGLLAWLLAGGASEEDGADAAAAVRDRAADLVARGLLTIDNHDDPRAEWVPRMPVPVWDLLHRGRLRPSGLPAGLRLIPAAAFPAPEEVVLAGPARAATHRLPDLLRATGDDRLSAVLVRGPDGGGRLTLLGAAAAVVGRPTLVHDAESLDGPAWRLLVPLAELADAQPVVVLRSAPGRTITLPALPDGDRPIGLVLGPRGGVAGPITERAVTVVLGPCGVAQRRELWERTIDATPDDLAAIASSFLLTPGNLRRAGQLATLAAAADGRSTVDPADVRGAARSLAQESIEALTTRLDPLDPGLPPVLRPEAATELDTLLARCCHRETLAIGTGLRVTANRGVRALFTGPERHGQDARRARSSPPSWTSTSTASTSPPSSTSTSARPRRTSTACCRAAEELDVVLLLDEGDALMAQPHRRRQRRTTATPTSRPTSCSSASRPSRASSWSRPTRRSRIDRAFLRRMDVMIDFAPPDADRAAADLGPSTCPPTTRSTPSLLDDVRPPLRR